MDLKFLEKILYVIAVVLMAANFLFDLPNVGKAGYAMLFLSFVLSFVSRKVFKK